jgi:Tol biopolymer transport system component
MHSARSASLQPGQTLLHYHLLEPIGEGGMGVVWRANDATLGRDVAIKVLPDVFAADPERVARFEREARVLASLNHPQIGAIYGFHATGTVRFLALELVEGEDLAQRLTRGAVAPGDAVAIGRQLAEALEYAHERGVVHRDFKPANIKLSPEGRVKVLDFGLAKALDTEAATSSSVWDPAHSPTLTVALTHAQVILGTAAYMSPEQARGRPVDKRADIWAFGVVLYEMLAGQRLFDGETASDTLASVLKTEIDWTAVPAGTPSRLTALVRRCLERDPQKRLRDVGEARITLEAIAAGAPDEAAPRAVAATSTSRFARMIPVAVGAVGLLTGVAATLALAPRGTSVGSGDSPRRFLAVPTLDAISEPTLPVVSPDGRSIAYVVRDGIWVRRLDELEPKQIAEVDNPVALAWSPDNEFIGYVSGTRILKAPVSGGEAQAVSDMRGQFTGGTGLTWTSKGTFIASRGEADGLLEVSDRGGDPNSILLPDTTKETDFHEPGALPGDKGILYAVHTREGTNTIEVFARGKRKVLLTLKGHSLAHPRYASTGHVLFWRSPPGPGIWAFPFSLARVERTGEPFLVAAGASMPSIADDGTLVYRTASEGGELQLVWMDRDGREISPIAEPGSGYVPEATIGSDGTSVYVGQDVSSNQDIWLLDAVRGTRTRLTFESSREQSAVPIAGTNRILYQVGPAVLASAGEWRIVARPLGGGNADTIAHGTNPRVSIDGKWATYGKIRTGGTDLYAIAIGAGTPEFPIAEETGNQHGGSISPSGGLVAYFSTEAGEPEVFLRSFPSGSGKWQVSQDGGAWPRWNRRGDRLFFVRDDDVMEVEISGGATPTLGTPRKLFSRPPAGRWFSNYPNSFDVSADGERFAIWRRPGAGSRARSIALAQNWIAEFRERKTSAR